MNNKKIFISMSEKDAEFLVKNYNHKDYVIWVLGPSAIDYLDRKEVEYKVLSDTEEHKELDHKSDYGQYAQWLARYDRLYRECFSDTLISDIEFFTNSINMLRIVSFVYRQLVHQLEVIAVHENCNYFYFFGYQNNPLNVLHENNTASLIKLSELAKIETDDIYLREIHSRIIPNWKLQKRKWRQKLSFLKGQKFRLFYQTFRSRNLDVLFLSEEPVAVKLAGELSDMGYKVNFFDQIYRDEISASETSLVDKRIQSLKKCILESYDDDFLIVSGFNFNGAVKRQISLFLETYIYETYKTIQSYQKLKKKPKKIISSLELPHWDAIIDFDTSVKFDLLLHGGTLGVMTQLPLINFGYKKNNENIRFISYSKDISSYCDKEKLEISTYKAKNTFANFGLLNAHVNTKTTPNRPLRIMYVQSVFARSVYQKEGSYQDAALYKLRKQVINSFLENTTTDKLTIKYGYNIESIGLDFDKKIIKGEIDRVNYAPSSVNLMDIYNNYDIFYVEIPSSSFTELVAEDKPVILYCDYKIGGVTPFLRDDLLKEITYVENSATWANIFKNEIHLSKLSRKTREKLIGGDVQAPSLKVRVTDNL